MSKFDELLASIKGENPELAENLTTAYIDDMESRDEKIKGLESVISTKDAKISEYAQENYDLMRAQPPASADNEGDKSEEKTQSRKVTLDDVANYWRNK